MAAYGAGEELACAALQDAVKIPLGQTVFASGDDEKLRAGSRYAAAHGGHARRFH